MRSVWMQELTWEDVAEYLETHDEVIVPIGSTESHGPHIPLGTDSYEAIDYAEAIADRAGVLVTPPIWYGDDYWHMRKAGTLALQPETVIAILKDIYSSLIEHGFRKIITFNGHRLANLPAIGIASYALKNQHPEVLFASMDPLHMGVTDAKIRTGGASDHGWELETSHILFKHPELAKPEKFVFSHGYFLETPFVTEIEFPGGDMFGLYPGPDDQHRLAPLGHVGDPTAASAEKGERLLEAIAAAGAEFIEDMRRWARNGSQVQGAAGEEGRELLRREMEWRAEKWGS